MPKILLVEDNEINREMLSRRLERKGYEVIVAVNGNEGVAKTLTAQPDLVLMDMHLPILDGWEATRQIKANPQTRGIPVIALTADAIASDREKALAAGCDEYDIKPVDFPRLLEKIAKLLAPQATLNSIPNQRLQGDLVTRLRRELDTPIYSIIGYSDMLLDELSGQQDLSFCDDDIQKIHTSGMQLLRLIHAILNPVWVEIQQQEINLLTPALRRELLTPLSTIIGYCELLLEETPANITPDLQQIYTSAQELLSKVNNLDNLVKQILKSINTHESDGLEPIVKSPITESLKRLETVFKDSNILVVDNASNGMLLTRQLERQGCKVAIATTSQQALQTITAMSYDLVLLDVSSPEINGLKVLEQLKNHQEWRHIPVLITAASDRMDIIVQGINLGAADYLPSPYQSVLLRNKVVACLKSKRQQNRNYGSLLENAPVGVYQATLAGRFQWVNAALVELLRYPTAKTLTETGINIAEQIYVDSSRYDEFKGLLEERDRAIAFEYQAYCHDGESIWLLEHARAVRDPDGQLVYYEGIVEEITQRKLEEASLIEQLTVLQLKLEQIEYNQQVAEIVQTDYFQQLQLNGEDRDASLPASPLKKVLLVEDNELNCDMLSRRLQRHGYEVVIATDGYEGVSKALSEQPQAILMDISLPVMDGWEATQKLKNDPQTCHIPVIALTAHAMAGDREKALAAGCDDYDTKPIELSRLLNKIEECLKRSGDR